MINGGISGFPDRGAPRVRIAAPRNSHGGPLLLTITVIRPAYHRYIIARSHCEKELRGDGARPLVDHPESVI